MKIALVFFLTLFLAGTVLSFQLNKNVFINRKPLYAETYAELLQRSKLAKLAKNNQLNQVQLPTPVVKPLVNKPAAVAAPVPAVVREEDGLPFDDSMYDHLKYVIGK